MDVLAGLAALALIGIYLYSRRPRRPAQGPLAAAPTPLSDLSPPALQAAAQGHSRVPAHTYMAPITGNLSVGFGYTPGHDRVDVFAPTDQSGEAFSAFEFSLASRRWLTDPPPDEQHIAQILKDTFPG